MRSLAKELILGKVPRFALSGSTSASVAEVRQIRDLIRSLVTIDTPDYGYSNGLSGTSFPPIPGMTTNFVVRRASFAMKSAEAMRRLVSYGPVALPFLLESLGDLTPTRINFRTGGIALLGQQRDFDWNPFNTNEAKVLGPYQVPRDYAQTDLSEYRVCIGDLCFVALGDIVGRDYCAVGYVPSGMAFVNSPARVPRLCDAFRSTWGSNAPRQALLDSLLIDYATRSIADPRADKAHYDADTFQSGAALRLLFYYPEYAVPLIVTRLKSLVTTRNLGEGSSNDLTDEQAKRYDAVEAANGIAAYRFLAAIAWCKDPAIQAEIRRIATTSDDQNIVKAARGLPIP